MISMIGDGDKFTLVIGITLADLDLLKKQGYLQHEDAQVRQLPVRFAIVFGETGPDLMEKFEVMSGRDIERPEYGGSPTVLPPLESE